MADGFANVAGPKRDDWDSAADPAQIVFHFDWRAKRIVLGKLYWNGKDVVLAPFQAGAKEGPHLVRSGAVIREMRVEAVRLERKILDGHIFGGGGS